MSASCMDAWCRRPAEPRDSGVFAAAEDAERTGGRIAEGGPGQPCSASSRSPGGRAPPPNIIQNRPSALAPAPGASEPGLAASAPSEPCGPRARAGRDLPRQDLADPAAARPSASRRGLTPTVHACNTRAARRGPQLGLRLGLGAPCAPRTAPLALTPSGWVLGLHRPGRSPRPTALPLPSHGPSALGRESGTGARERRRAAPVLKSLEPVRVRARPTGLQSWEVPDMCNCAALGFQRVLGGAPSLPYSADEEMGSQPGKVTCQGYTTGQVLKSRLKA
ncbi:PREDICTED: translation initiation factor IF-2-like [Rhinopithecus bieti]|uniref:translation initiation factor IF-2-like n=1 Tax=Rhinopithecus bieti TaxID=61621 RepID=UPI00083BE9B7|nr:PREDICTED: translation initiation factor IF-2-like [Rhinopithecus bieti]